MRISTSLPQGQRKFMTNFPVDMSWSREQREQSSVLPSDYQGLPLPTDASLPSGRCRYHSRHSWSQECRRGPQSPLRIEQVWRLSDDGMVDLNRKRSSFHLIQIGSIEYVSNRFHETDFGRRYCGLVIIDGTVTIPLG